ncbi:hypothetical protein LCGC14_2791170 [marine sediment metagenome]|uniref:Uncharacterized protein n=1 Tax=marine sediment metagenome TaxID=412755 RepID=A0A0F8YQE8_9ZZZZ
MTMTVGELIKELRKHPRGAFVGWQDHDAEETEISAHVTIVCEFDEEDSFDPEYCKGIGVVLRG